MDPRDLASRLREDFPDASVLMPITVLGEGFGSTVVETGSGLVFRIAKHAVAQLGHRRELRVLPIIQRHVSALQVPRISYVLDSSIAFPYGAIGYEKLPGRPLAPDDLDEENRGHIAAQVAGFLTELHGIDVAETVVAGLPAFPPRRERLADLWQNVSAHLARQLRRSDYRRLHRWHDRLLGYRERYPYAPCLVHGDLWYENCLIDDERRRLVGIVDFENASVGDAAVDLATQRYLGDRFARQVIDAYPRDRLPSDLDGRVNDLLGLRELLGLEHGLMTGEVDEDALQKVKDAILPVLN